MIRWLRRVIARFVCPELRRMGASEAQDSVIHDAMRLERATVGHELVSVSFVLLWAVAGMGFIHWLEPLLRHHVPRALSYVVFFTLAPLAIGITAWWAKARHRLRALRRVLRSRGIAICEGCGYDLRGLDSSRCPECGTQHEGTD